jgi:hypothetical protein
MLGLNAVRRLGLDGDAIARVAERVGPSVDELMHGPPVTPELRGHFDLRGGYLKPAEREERIAETDTLINVDLVRLREIPTVGV